MQQGKETPALCTIHQNFCHMSEETKCFSVDSHEKREDMKTPKKRQLEMMWAEKFFPGKRRQVIAKI